MFCTQPFNHIDILVENDQITYLPCNVWKGNSIALQDFPNTITNVQSILKNNFDKNNCEVCILNEKSGVISRRQSTNSFTKDNNLSLDKIQSIGLRYGTLCNLKCMICDVSRSSSWYNDTIKLGKNVRPKYKYNKNIIPSLEVVFQDIDLSQIRYVSFHGGEPLIQPYPIEFLKKVDRQNINVVFNTNGSVFPNKELLNLLNECKKVQFLLSIDDVGDRFDLLRFPNKWKVVLENIKKFKQTKHELKITNCISSLNVWYMDEFYKWAISNFGTNIDTQYVFYPEILNIQTLSPNLKLKISKKLNHLGSPFRRIIEVMNQNNNKNYTSKTVDYINKLDNIRNTNFTKIFAEWYNLLNQ